MSLRTLSPRPGEWVVAFFLALAILPPPATAEELADGKLSINAYGQAGYGKTTSNSYTAGTEEGSFHNTALSLVITAHPYERLSIVAEPFFSDKEGASLDWLFAEWRFSDAFRLRLGKVQHPFGLFGETYDIGTLRPFFELPMGVYGPAGLVSESYQGVGITGSLESSAGFGVTYDLYGGAITVMSMEPFEGLVEPGALEIGKAIEEEPEELSSVVGGRLGLITPLDGLSVRFSAYRGMRGERGHAQALHVVFGPSVEYLAGPWTARAEYFHHRDGMESVDAAYVELAYFVFEHWQVAARADASQAHLDEYSGSSPLLRHRDLALGLNYWFNPAFVVKLSYHDVDGNRFALPEDAARAILDNRLEESTRMVLLGAQFSF